MTREEYYAGIEAYKNKLEHRAMDANAEDTAGKALENWKNQHLNQAINLRAKQYLASKFGRTDDASTYEKQLQILLDKMTNLKGVSLSAKQALMQTIDQTATNKANVQYAKHSDEEASDNLLEHGAWKNHKYIRIDNGRYIYEDPQAKENAQKAQTDGQKKTSTIKTTLRNLANIAGFKYQSDGIKKTEDTKKGMAENAVNKYQEDGMKRTALEEYRDSLKKQAEEEKKKEAESVRQKHSDNNAANSAKADGEAMQAWKDAQKSKSNENARAEIEETGSISKETKTESSRQTTESASAAKREGEAQQRYKEKQEAAAKAAKLSISAWASGETTDKPGKYANEVNELIKSLDLGGDENFQKQYISEVVKIYDQERDKLPPNVRSIIDKELADLKDRYKPKKIGHSLNLTREEYYAGIEEYKRKKK